MAELGSRASTELTAATLRSMMLFAALGKEKHTLFRGKLNKCHRSCHYNGARKETLSTFMLVTLLNCCFKICNINPLLQQCRDALLSSPELNQTSNQTRLTNVLVLQQIFYFWIMLSATCTKHTAMCCLNMSCFKFVYLESVKNI